MFRSVITTLMLTTAIAHAFVGCSASLHCLFCHDDDGNVTGTPHPSTELEPVASVACKHETHQHGSHQHGPSDSPQEHQHGSHDGHSHGHPGDHCTFVVKLPGIDAGLRWQERIDRDHLANVTQPTHAINVPSAFTLLATTSTRRADAAMFRALGVLLL